MIDLQCVVSFWQTIRPDWSCPDSQGTVVSHPKMGRMSENAQFLSANFCNVKILPKRSKGHEYHIDDHAG